MVENNTSAQSILKAEGGSEQPAKRSWLATVLEWLPYPISIGLGYYALDGEVKKSIYANVAKKKYFGDLWDKRNANYSAVLNRGAVDGKSIAQELHVIEETYRQEVKTAFRDKFGMKGIGDYWRAIQDNQRVSAIVMGATVTSIVLGAAFLIKENEKIQAAFDRIAHKKKEDQQSER